MFSRVMDHPVLTLMAIVSAILILVGRLNRLQPWGDWVFIAGIVVLVVAGVLYFVMRR